MMNNTPFFRALVEVGYPQPRAIEAFSAWERAGRPEVEVWLISFGVPVKFIKKALAKIGDTAVEIRDAFSAARAANQQQRQAAERTLSQLRASQPPVAPVSPAAQSVSTTVAAQSAAATRLARPDSVPDNVIRAFPTMQQQLKKRG